VDEEIDLFDVELKVKLLEEKEMEHFIIRKCLLTDEVSGESRQVVQFHYTAWPDFGLPESPASFLEYLTAVRESGLLDLSNEVGPSVVHCSAGIGRSGTFCLVDSCLLLIDKHKSSAKVNVKTILLEMRKFRMGLIQTPEQLRFSYQAIIEGAKCLELEKKEVTNTRTEARDEGNGNGLRARSTENGGSKEMMTHEMKERERLERKRKTQETIDRIKDHKKQVDERSRFQAKVVRFGLIGLALIVGTGFIYSYLTCSSTSLQTA